MPLPVALRALAHRNFRLFVAGQLTSLIGTWMQMVAQGWLVYRLTGSSLYLGLVGFTSQIPVFLLSTAGGVIADRWPRRRVLILTQSAMMVLAFILAALTMTGAVRMWHVFVLAGSFCHYFTIYYYVVPRAAVYFLGSGGTTGEVQESRSSTVAAMRGCR